MPVLPPLTLAETVSCVKVIKESKFVQDDNITGNTFNICSSRVVFFAMLECSTALCRWLTQTTECVRRSHLLNSTALHCGGQNAFDGQPTTKTGKL